MKELAINSTPADPETLVKNVVLAISVHLVHLRLGFSTHLLVQDLADPVLLGTAHVQETFVEAPVSQLSHQLRQAELVRDVQFSRPIAGDNRSKDSCVLVEEVLVFVVRIVITVVEDRVFCSALFEETKPRAGKLGQRRVAMHRNTGYKE